MRDHNYPNLKIMRPKTFSTGAQIERARKQIVWRLIILLEWHLALVSLAWFQVVYVYLKGRYHEKMKCYFFALKCSLWGIK